MGSDLAADAPSVSVVPYSFRATIDMHGAVFSPLSTSGPVIVPPTVTILGPSPGTTIGSTTPISLKVEDEEDSFKRIIIVAEFPASRVKEVVYDGNGFGPMYTNSQNTISTIAQGYTFQIVRDGGWIPNDGPILTPFVIDTTGGENE